MMETQTASDQDFWAEQARLGAWGVTTHCEKCGAAIWGAAVWYARDGTAWRTPGYTPTESQGITVLCGSCVSALTR